MAKAKPDELDEHARKWIAEHEALMNEGYEIVDRALEDALDYLGDAIENMNDKQWRKMVMSTQTVEMGIGVALAEQLVPVVYGEMHKTMHKKLKIKKETAQALRHIFIGRVIKNVRKELNARDSK